MSVLNLAMRRAGEGGFDVPVAAFAGAAAGAVIFMVPVDLLQNLMVDSGLASIVPPLGPPLGGKSRIAIALVAAAIAFGLVLLLMRMLGRTSHMFEVEEEHDAPPLPRVRRRDQHPDAPARVPFSVTRDMGEAPVPAPRPKPKLVEPTSGTQRRRAPLAEILAAESRGDAVAPHEGEPAAEEPARRIKPGREAEAATDESELLLIDPQPHVEPTEAEPFIRPAWIDSAAAAAGAESLASLMARLEGAIERRVSRAAPATGAAAATADSAAAGAPEEPEGMDSRLRSALENLKRFAPRQG